MRRKPHEERVAPPSGRPLEVSGDRHPRWMTITALARGTELGLQAASLALLRSFPSRRRRHLAVVNDGYRPRMPPDRGTRSGKAIHEA